MHHEYQCGLETMSTWAIMVASIPPLKTTYVAADKRTLLDHPTPTHPNPMQIPEFVLLLIVCQKPSQLKFAGCLATCFTIFQAFTINLNKSDPLLAWKLAPKQPKTVMTELNKGFGIKTHTISVDISRMRFVQFIFKCAARVPISLWGSVGWGCVRSTLRLRPQPSATVRSRSQPFAWGPYGGAYGKFCKRGHFWMFPASQLRFAWQAWQFVTFRRVL